MSCYNCGSLTHKSAQCNLAQQFTRCPTCNVVASTPAGHKVWCTSNSFQSVRISPTQATVYELQTLIGLDFLLIEDTFAVLDGNREIIIGDKPLWMLNMETFVSQTAHRSLEFSSSRPGRKNLTIANKQNKTVVSIDI